jgi:hypothetical protein
VALVDSTASPRPRSTRRASAATGKTCAPKASRLHTAEVVAPFSFSASRSFATICSVECLQPGIRLAKVGHNTRSTLTRTGPKDGGRHAFKIFETGRQRLFRELGRRELPPGQRRTTRDSGGRLQDSTERTRPDKRTPQIRVLENSADSYREPLATTVSDNALKGVNMKTASRATRLRSRGMSALSATVSPADTSTRAGRLRYHHCRMRTMCTPGSHARSTEPSGSSFPAGTPSRDTLNVPRR